LNTIEHEEQTDEYTFLVSPIPLSNLDSASGTRARFPTTAARSSDATQDGHQLSPIEMNSHGINVLLVVDAEVSASLLGRSGPDRVAKGASFPAVLRWRRHTRKFFIAQFVKNRESFRASIFMQRPQ